MIKHIGIGAKFGMLTIISIGQSQGKKNRTRYICECQCGNRRLIRADSLKSGHTISCGCLSAQRLIEGRTKHGRHKSRIYCIWQSMKRRCNDPSFRNYGEKGIKVCARWENFANFAVDMGDPPIGLSIDRINSNGDYEPNNCRWATPAEQMRNTRRNIWIDWNGERLVLTDWANKLNIKVDTLYSRIVIYGWSIRRAFQEPIHYKNNREATI